MVLMENYLKLITVSNSIKEALDFIESFYFMSNTKTRWWASLNPSKPEMFLNAEVVFKPKGSFPTAARENYPAGFQFQILYPISNAVYFQAQGQSSSVCIPPMVGIQADYVLRVQPQVL